MLRCGEDSIRETLRVRSLVVSNRMAISVDRGRVGILESLGAGASAHNGALAESIAEHERWLLFCPVEA